MSHQPFELWLFDEQSLTPEQSHALQEHLQGCDACYNLAVAWRQIQPLMSAAPLVTPAPGFSTRWQECLEHDRKALLRRQSLFVLSFGIGSAAIFLAMLVAIVLVSIESPMEWFVLLVTRVTSLITFAGAMQDVYGVLRSVVPTSWVAGVALGITGLSIVWLISLQKFALSRRISS